MGTSDWNRFTLKGNFNANVQALYHVWTTQKGLEWWFLRSALFYAPTGEQRAPGESVKKGDTYTWMWHGYDDEVFEKGTVLEANGKDLFQFTFTGGCIVTIAFKEEGEITMVELTQEKIPTESDPAKNLYVQCSIGWTFYLANLKSLVEGGKDLRNKEVTVASVFK